MNPVTRLWYDDGGQDVVEYGLIAALVSIIALATIKSTGPGVQNLWTSISNTIVGA